MRSAVFFCNETCNRGRQAHRALVALLLPIRNDRVVRPLEMSVANSFILRWGKGKVTIRPLAPIIISGVRHDILAPPVLPATGSRRTSCPPLRPVHAFALGAARQRIGSRYGWPGSLRLKASSPQRRDCLQGLVAGLQGRLLRHGAPPHKEGWPRPSLP